MAYKMDRGVFKQEIKIAVFDFCGTLANYQTLEPFLKKVVCELHPIIFKIIDSKCFIKICDLFTHLFRKLGYKDYIYKSILVYCTKGCDEKLFEELGPKYYIETVKPNLISETLKFMEMLKNSGYKLLIISGGSRYYIKQFADEYKVDNIITAEIEFRDGKSQGKLVRSCLNEEKVNLLRRYLLENDIQDKIDICVTDSISDKPILDIAKRKVAVSYCSHQKWVEDDMEEIIWA